jgi:predicted CXXCH cytochrome family protein
MLTGLLAIALLLGAPPPKKTAPKADKPAAARTAPAKSARSEKNAQMKLKPGAEGPLCLQCHVAFKEQLEKPFVHTPVKTRDCIGCHSPHASRHGKLLAADKSSVCLTCHSTLVVKEPKSTHKPVADGSCVSCHDPHASSNKAQLVKAGAALCASCHQALTDGVAKATVKHPPLEKQGCTACHLPHGSGAATKLLKAEVPALCVNCHKPDAKLIKAHMGYPVGGARCTSCHDPHGSSQPGMLYDTVHKPVAAKNCGQCHGLASDPKPFLTRREGIDLCRSCHAEKVAQMLDKSAVHQPVIDQRACLNCHSPHASKTASLLAGPMKTVCATCHADTIARQQHSPGKHPPVMDGNCTACHDPHGTNGTLLLSEKLQPETCAPCHEHMAHSSHPIGAKFKDPRNKNLTVNCLSCHRAHGTEYKKLIPFAKSTDLCTTCHERFKR